MSQNNKLQTISLFHCFTRSSVVNKPGQSLEVLEILGCRGFSHSEAHGEQWTDNCSTIMADGLLRFDPCTSFVRWAISGRNILPSHRGIIQSHSSSPQKGLMLRPKIPLLDYKTAIEIYAGVLECLRCPFLAYSRTEFMPAPNLRSLCTIPHDPGRPSCFSGFISSGIYNLGKPACTKCSRRGTTSHPTWRLVLQPTMSLVWKTALA